jgi:hypothetical protein
MVPVIGRETAPVPGCVAPGPLTTAHGWRFDLPPPLKMSEQALAQLRFIVDGFATHGEYQHLLNICSNTEYLVQQQDVAPLETELRRLRALGLIEQVRPYCGVARFAAADNAPRRVAEWFRLTSRGEEYLSMRKENEAAEGTPAAHKTRPDRELCRYPTATRGVARFWHTAVGVGEEPVVADAVEALGQHVHQETPDELVRVKPHRLPPVRTASPTR